MPSRGHPELGSSWEQTLSHGGRRQLDPALNLGPPSTEQSRALSVPVSEAAENQEAGQGRARGGQRLRNPQHHAPMTASVAELSGGLGFLPLASGLCVRPPPRPPPLAPATAFLMPHLQVMLAPPSPYQHECRWEVTLGKSGKLSEP